MMKAFIKLKDDIFVPISIHPGGTCTVEDRDLFEKHSGACYDPRIFSYETLDRVPRVYSYDLMCCRMVMEICSCDENNNPVKMSDEEWDECLKISSMMDSNEEE